MQLLLIAVFSTVCAAREAVSPPAYVVTGMVTDEKNETLVGASVALFNPIQI